MNPHKLVVVAICAAHAISRDRDTAEADRPLFGKSRTPSRPTAVGMPAMRTSSLRSRTMLRGSEQNHSAPSEFTALPSRSTAARRTYERIVRTDPFGDRPLAVWPSSSSACRRPRRSAAGMDGHKSDIVRFASGAEWCCAALYCTGPCSGQGRQTTDTCSDKDRPTPQLISSSMDGRTAHFDSSTSEPSALTADAANISLRCFARTSSTCSSCGRYLRPDTPKAQCKSNAAGGGRLFDAYSPCANATPSPHA